jgi:hypothetical protein
MNHVNGFDTTGADLIKTGFDKVLLSGLFYYICCLALQNQDFEEEEVLRQHHYLSFCAQQLESAKVRFFM